MDDWEWLHADWLEIVSQISLFVVLFIGGPWIVQWLLKGEEHRRKAIRWPRSLSRRSRRGVRKQTPSRAA